MYTLLSKLPRTYNVTYPHVHPFTRCFAFVGLFAPQRPLKEGLFSLYPQSIFHHSIEFLQKKTIFVDVFFVDTVVCVSSGFSLTADCMVPTRPLASGCAFGYFLIHFSHPALPKVMQPVRVSCSIWSAAGPLSVLGMY